MANDTNLPATQAQTPRPALLSGSKVAALVPVDIEQAWRLAGIISQAQMAPKSYGTDQNKIMVGIIHGMEVGLTPMAALQSIAVINGTPSIWGDGALALIQASGLLEDMEETVDGEGDQMIATCMMRRRGRATPIARTFSVADAKKAALWGKAGPWQNYPQRMLKMRARSWAMRDGFADILKGLGIGEEIEDIAHQGPDNARDITPPRPTRESIAAPEPEKDPEPELPSYELYDEVGTLECTCHTAEDFAEKLTAAAAHPRRGPDYVKNNAETAEIVLAEMEESTVKQRLQALYPAEAPPTTPPPAADQAAGGPPPEAPPAEPDGSLEIGLVTRSGKADWSAFIRETNERLSLIKTTGDLAAFDAANAPTADKAPVGIKNTYRMAIQRRHGQLAGKAA